MDLWLKLLFKNKFAAVLLLILLLAACQQEDSPLPTTAPRIPTITPTPSATPSPSYTPFPGTIPPTAERNLPSWTPSPSQTLRPSNTPFPTSTITPSATPTQNRSSADVLTDGTIHFMWLEADINTALADAEFTTTLEIEPDGLIVHINILNPFLAEISQIRAVVQPQVTEGEVQLTLRNFTSEGPTVTRQQVQEHLATVEDFLKSHLPTALNTIRPQAGEIRVSDLTLIPDFLVLEITLP